MKRSLFALSCWLLAPAAFAILDVNSNGISDFWEREFNNGNLFDEFFDPQADDDSDGWINAQEAAAGTNPFDPNPPDGLIRPVTDHVPAVIEEENGVPDVKTPEAVKITWPTLAGKQYTMYFSPDLTQGSWLPVGSPFIAQGGVSEYGFQELSVADKRFWRVAVEDIDEDSDGLTNHEELLSGTNPMIADTDGDTLSDHTEIIAGTDPNHADTDYDGMEDRWENAHGLDPTDWYDAYHDPDGDGIQNQFEYVLGFHPTVANPAELTADRDNDGMPDYWEAQTGSFQWSYATQQYEFQRMLDWENPADAAQDPDFDDLTNLAEYQNTTNPFDYDTDGDNLSDGWEIQYGFNPKSTASPNGATDDPDGDGIENQYEQALGFHPTTANAAEQTADRDNDGMPDAWEAATSEGRHTSPETGTGITRLIRALDWEIDDSAEDYDSDGLANLLEYQAGLGVADPDSDDDLLPDGWEILYGFDPFTPLSDALTADPDGDGYSNFLAAIMGTDPYDNTSYPPTPPGNNIPGTPYPGGGTNPTTPPTPPSPNTGTAQWSFEAVTSSKKLPKHGYAEFSPTAPLKRYLKLLESVSFGLHGECDPPETRIDGTRLTTVNPLDGTQQADDRQHPGNNNMGCASTAQSPVVAVGISQVTSYDDDPNSESDCDATKTYSLNLSQENTTEQLNANTRAQLPSYQSTYSTWQTPHA